MSIIRHANKNDVEPVALLHNHSLPPPICDLTDLGENLLKIFYQTVLTENTGYLAVAAEGDVVIGFCLITKDTNKLFKTSFFKSFGQLLKIIFASNKVNLVKVFFKKVFYNSLITDDKPQLVYIGIDKNYFGKGIAQQLLENVEQKFIEWNFQEYTLDVEEENLSARKFYEKNNFIVDRKYRLGRKNKYLLKKAL